MPCFSMYVQTSTIKGPLHVIDRLWRNKLKKSTIGAETENVTARRSRVYRPTRQVASDSISSF